MTDSPNPFNRKILTRGLIAGAALAVLGIVLFFVIWSSLAGSGEVARLFTALCIPPVLIGVIVGAYFMFFRRRT